MFDENKVPPFQLISESRIRTRKKKGAKKRKVPGKLFPSFFRLLFEYNIGMKRFEWNEEKNQLLRKEK